MKLVLTVACAMFLGSTLIVAQNKTNVFGTGHDIAAGPGGCKNCHAPHATTDAAGQRGQTLLWANAFSNQVFGLYDSPTLDNDTVEIGDATYGDGNPPVGVTQASVLCMSCHDGVTTTSLIAEASPLAVGNPTTSFGLTNDHPVNMPYDAGADPGLEPTPATGIVLYNNGTDDTVQCGSCHNPHDDTLGSYLRIANLNVKAGLCGACHL